MTSSAPSDGTSLPVPATPTPSDTPSPSATLPPTSTPTRTAAPTATASSTPTPPILERTENILVLGVDHRAGDPDPSWRTDTIMVLAIDRAQGQVGVISIPRDLYVDIPGMGMARINQADFHGEWTDYPGGGPALIRRVLTETLGIPTQNYVRIQMEGLVRLVDALGGISVTLECPLYERTPDESSPNGVVDWNLPAGAIHLDGATAKKFVTYRYVTSDFGRAQRQQQVIWAIRDRALSTGVIPRIPELWRALADTFETDLSVLEVARLAAFGATLGPDRVRGLVFSTEALDYFVTEEGGWVLVIRDKDKLEAEKADIFSARPLAQTGKAPDGECPPSPTPVPTFTPTPTGTLTAVPTATPAHTPTPTR